MVEGAGLVWGAGAGWQVHGGGRPATDGTRATRCGVRPPSPVGHATTWYLALQDVFWGMWGAWQSDRVWEGACSAEQQARRRAAAGGGSGGGGSNPRCKRGPQRRDHVLQGPRRPLGGARRTEEARMGRASCCQAVTGGPAGRVVQASAGGLRRPKRLPKPPTTLRSRAGKGGRRAGGAGMGRPARRSGPRGTPGNGPQMRAGRRAARRDGGAALQAAGRGASPHHIFLGVVNAVRLIHLCTAAVQLWLKGGLP